MGEVVNVLVAFAVIVFLFRWVTSPSGDVVDRANTLGFRPKTITQEMVDTIQNMFPDIPTDNIRYDLLRTGSVAQTSNKILERGFLEAPPAAYFTLFPRDPNAANANARTAATTSSATTATPQQNASLIARFKLEDRIATPAPPITDEEVGGKAVWEENAEKREASLKERKAKMILAARQRMLAQKQNAEKSSTGSASSSSAL